MRPRFERYIGIDYSGAQTPRSSLKGLRVYEADRSSDAALGRSIRYGPRVVILHLETGSIAREVRNCPWEDFSSLDIYLLERGVSAGAEGRK
jgi:hypothetical protein